MTLDKRSLAKLEGVHEDLVKVVMRAAELSAIAFVVTEGRRSLEQQTANVAKGVSKTMRSRHVGPISYAVDIAALIDGKVVWKPWSLYEDIAKAFKEAAKELDIPIAWGGDWHSFKDGCHFELPWHDYPVSDKSTSPPIMGRRGRLRSRRQASG